MRKHDVRKWLHAILDLLPIFVIPAFMIFTQNHDVQDDTVIVTPTPVYYESNEVDTVDDLVVGNVYRFSFDYNTDNVNYTILCDKTYLIDVVVYGFGEGGSFARLPYIAVSDNRVYYPLENVSETIVTRYVSFKITVDFVLADPTGIPNTNCIFQCPITNYLKEYIDVETIVPNNVGTSLMNNFINTSNEFFNFDNVFTFGDIHNWVNTNIFGGNPPAVVGAIWNIIVYEFLMDMLFLFYSLFMFLIDFIESCMERAFCKANHGGVK